MDRFSNGHKIGTKYQVIEFLGEGSTSQVYKVLDLANNQILALKYFLTDSVNINFICQEFRLVADLAHPHLARVLGYEHFRDSCFYVMEYLPGPDIIGCCRRQGFEEKCQRLIELCQALEYIHSKDIVHLDIKPSNLLADESGRIKLLDFGLAQGTAGDQTLKISGTPSYISPEMISGLAPDGRADLYSLGVLMYQIFTGALPFEAPSLRELVKKHLYHPPQPPRVYDDSMPESLQALILRLLSKDPNGRPALAWEVAAELSRIIKRDAGEPTPSARTSFIFNSRMVGRDKELNHLRHALQNAIAGQGWCFFLSGETGVGRTKLLTEFSLQAQLMECQVLWARCYQPDCAAYDIIIQLIEQVRSLAQSFCPQFLTEFGPILAEIIPAFKELPEIKEQPAPAALPAREQRLRLLDAIANFMVRTLEALPVRATVILLESIQSVDRESLEALSHLLRNISRSSLLVVGSYRSDEIGASHYLTAAVEGLVSENLAEQIFLKRLSRPEVAEMLGNIFPRLPGPEALLEKVFSETEGNPLLIEECLHYLMDNGYIERRRGKWQMTALSPERLALPQGLRKAFEVKLKSLSPDQLLLLQALAVMERPSSFQQLATITGLEQIRLSRELQHLKSQNLIALLPKEKSEPLYGLHHAKIIPEIYRTISGAMLVKLHGEAAGILAQQERCSVQDMVLLSRHWELAQDAVRAAECHLQAGDGLAEHSKMQAIEHYSKALALSPSPRPEVMEKLQKLYYVSGEYQKALEVAEKTHKINGPSPDTYYKLGRCQERLGNYDQSAEYLRQGLDLAQDDPQATARLMGALALTNISRGEYRTAEKACLSALKLLPHNGKPAVEAELYNTLGQAYWHLAEWAQALSVHRKSLEIKEREGSLYGIATSYNNLGAVYYRMYDWDKAAECHKKSFSIREKIGDISGLARSYNNLALIYRHIYDWDRALEYHGKCLQTMERIGAGFETAASLVDIGLIHKAKGEWDQALWSYNRAIQMAVNLGARNILLDAYIRKAELYLALGSLEDSSLFCQKSLDLAEELGGRLELGRTMNISGRISQMRQQWDKAKETLSLAREIFSELDIKAGEAFILKNLADLHRELGELDQASSLADKALSLAQRVEEQQLAAEVLLLKGDLLEEKGQDGYKYMEWALEVAEKVNTSETTWPIYSAIARHHLKKRDYPQALECYRKILATFKQTLGNIGQPELKTSYVFSPKRRQLFRDIKLLRQEVSSHAG